ncbi:MAG: hypothetical protein OXT07_08845 [bacterium]|nr:hypothetical protein [bacterium]
MSSPSNVAVILLDSLNRHMLGSYGGTDFHCWDCLRGHEGDPWRTFGEWADGRPLVEPDALSVLPASTAWTGACPTTLAAHSTASRPLPSAQ